MLSPACTEGRKETGAHALDGGQEDAAGSVPAQLVAAHAGHEAVLVGVVVVAHRAEEGAAWIQQPRRRLLQHWLRDWRLRRRHAHRLQRPAVVLHMPPKKRDERFVGLCPSQRGTVCADGVIKRLVLQIRIVSLHARLPAAGCAAQLGQTAASSCADRGLQWEPLAPSGPQKQPASCALPCWRWLGQRALLGPLSDPQRPHACADASWPWTRTTWGLVADGRPGGCCSELPIRTAF